MPGNGVIAWPHLLAELEAKRAAIDQVITIIRAQFADQIVPTIAFEPIVPAKKKPGPKPKTLADVVRTNGDKAPKGFAGECAEAIATFLAKQEHRCSDGAVIRREVAKMLKRKAEDKDFADACRNSFTKLKGQGKVTRQGTMWTLTT